MKHVISIIFAVSLSVNVAMANEQRTLCVFDPLGSYGQLYGLVKEYAQSAKEVGVHFNLKAYTDEAVAANDFLGDACDASVLTGTRARAFNKFTGSIEAIGGLPNYDQFKILLGYISNPKLAKYLVEGNYEIAGIYPLGAVYVYVNDREINSAAKLAGKRLATMSFDNAANTMVKHVGAAPVSADITSFAGKFNNGYVDVCYAPSLAYDAFELYKGLEPKGGIVRFPLAQMNTQVILKADRFPEGFAMQSRSIVQKQIDKAFAIINQQDSAIDKKWWIELPEEDKASYMEMFRGVRIALANDGTYHPLTLKLMKKIRCKMEPTHSECTRKGE